MQAPTVRQRAAAGLLAAATLLLACFSAPASAARLPGGSQADGAGAVALPTAAAPLAAGTLAVLPSDADMQNLEATLGYQFLNKWLLREALIHPSYGEFNNARLTWIGDAVLGSIVSDLVFQALPPSATTADLHNARMAHVSRASCAVHARSLNLQHMLVLGKGYEGTEPTPHMLAEAFEAVWGAIHVDLGFKIDVAKKSYALLFPVEG